MALPRAGLLQRHGKRVLRALRPQTGDTEIASLGRWIALPPVGVVLTLPMMRRRS